MEFGYYASRHGSDSEVKFNHLYDAIEYASKQVVGYYKYIDDMSFSYAGVVFAVQGYNDPEEDGYVESETWSVRKSDLISNR